MYTNSEQPCVVELDGANSRAVLVHKLEDIQYIHRSNKMLLKVLEEYALKSLIMAMQNGSLYIYNVGVSRLHDDKLHTVGAHEIMALAELIVGEFIKGYSFDFDYEKFTIRRI